MIQQTDVKFRKYFLMQFTKELMRATDSYKDAVIKSQVKLKIHKTERLPPAQVYKTPPRAPIRKIVRHIIKQKTHRDTQLIRQMKKEAPIEDLLRPSIMRSPETKAIPVAPKKEKPFEKFFRPNAMRQPTALSIPNLALPKTVQYIHPVPGQRQVKLGKLEPLVRDPFVKTIECNGPAQKIVVTGLMGRKNTSITLTKEEIDGVINAFAAVSHIPAQEGFFKVAVGKLILSAIVSKIVSSKFIITKMSEPNYFNYLNHQY